MIVIASRLLLIVIGLYLDPSVDAMPISTTGAQSHKVGKWTMAQPTKYNPLTVLWSTL